MNYHPKFTLNDKIKSNLQEIARLKNLVSSSRIVPEAELSIRYRASIETIHSSTSIEGNPLTANEVRAVIASDQLLTKEEYAEIEVQNYGRALEYIDQRRRGDNLISLADALELHRIITDRLLGQTRCGKLRRNPVYIENEKKEVLYTAAPPEQVEGELTNLLEFINNNQFTLHPALLAGILHFQFVAIHPFSDGNGRTARALTSLFLALNQYDNNGSLVLDSYYATDRKSYYDTLARTNGKNYTISRKSDLTPWLEYFTGGFVTSLHVLDAEIRMLNLSLSDLEGNHLSREDEDILSYISKFGAITISEAENILSEIDRRTLQRRLKNLVDRGYLELVGATHDAKYILKSPAS